MFYPKNKAQLTLIRWPNLALLAAIQLLAYLAFVSSTWTGSTIHEIQFVSSLIWMTTCAAAAGYIINDLFDRKADAFNNRMNVLNGEFITEKQAWHLYYASVAFGFIISFILSRESIHFLWIYGGTTLLLWLYSRHFKHWPFMGNLIVSVVCGLVILLVWYPVHPISQMPLPLLWLAAFAFLVTLIREIVKDMEDMHGDQIVGDRTLPIIAGIRFCRLMVALLHLVTLFLLLHPDVRVGPERILPFMCWILTLALVGFSMFLFLFTAKDKETYHRSSSLLKFVMLMGTCSFVF